MTDSTQRDTFLAVDDAPESLELMRIILTRYFPGARVLVESRSVKALEIARREHPTLVLLDVKMPVMDGFEFARLMRADPALSATPVLMMSGVSTDVQSRITGLEAGAESFLAKPYEPMELVAQVRALLRIHHSEEALRTHHAELETELARRTAKLRASEHKFRMLFENLPDAVFVEDESGIVLDANLAACRLHETSRAQIVGVHVSALAPPEQRAQVTKLYPQWFQSGLERVESESYTATGRRVPVEIRARKIEYDGRPAMLLHVRDLNERRLASQVHERDVDERQNVQDERNRLILAVEQLAEAIIITDAEGVIQYVNRAFEQITGYLRPEALGRRPSLLRSGQQDEEFYKGMWTTIVSGKVWSGRVINKRKDGKLFHAELTISPVRDTHDEVINFVAVSRDITREVDLEAQLHQIQKMESIGRLAGGVAHDFNNLLTSILGFAHIVSDRLPKDHPQQHEMKEIVFAGERAAQLTRQLLTFSRKQSVLVMALDINELLREMEQLLRRTLGEDIELRVDLDPHLGPSLGDPMQMQQILLNLAVNARDAMPRGGHLTISTQSVQLDEAFCATRVGLHPGSHIRLSIRDDGSGIAEANRAQIFEPFFTTKGREGTGLGLSIVYAIVKQSRGHIEFETEVGRGTEFILYFPQQVAGAAAAAAVAPTAPAVATGPLIGGTETILVVEDDELVRDLAQRLLASLGYGVLTASGAREAEVICRRNQGPLHLILSDVVMPQVSGNAMVRKLRTLRQDFKVVYMSGFTEDTIVHHGIVRQDVNFLAKPFTRETLGAKVREVLDAKP
jgi:PAS domain S-box-containing protein